MINGIDHRYEIEVTSSYEKIFKDMFDGSVCVNARSMRKRGEIQH